MSASIVNQTLQNAMYIAINLQDILYGAELVLYFETIHTALTVRTKWGRSEVLHVLFSTVMLILITIWVSTNAIFGEEMWLIHSDYPGGADAYYMSNISSWYLIMGRAAVFVLQLMTDALLIHRCWAVWNNTYAIVVPSILWVATLVLGALSTWMLAFDAVSFVSSFGSRTALAYYTVCVFLNVTLTSMICYRIIRYGKLVQAELGREYSLGYFAVAGIIVESALPFTLSSIAFLVTWGVNSQVMIPFEWVYFMMTCISPQMLILRVLSRKNIVQSTSEFTSPATNIQFQPDAQAGDESEGTLHWQQLSRVPSRGDTDSAIKMVDRTDAFP
ncbi:hypothetical protein HD554DRAFT_1768688 [Boletus coccyginus]|nr:hypothetical protein HD554DRAFT_1768688 [Boletus coccyginus]